MKSFIKNISLLSVIVLTAVLFTTCRKYPEDEFISLRTVKQRLEAEWQIQKIEFNGNDVTYMYNDSLSPLNITDFYFWFKNNESEGPDSERKNFIYVNKSSKNSKDAKSYDVYKTEFSLNDRKKHLWIMFSSDDIHVNEYNNYKILSNLLFVLYSSQWEINTLYKNELKITKLINGSVFKLYMTKTRKK